MPRRTLLEKARAVEEAKGLLQRHKVIGIASLQKVRASQLQELRRKLRGVVHLYVTKNNVMKRAIAECKDKPALKGFEKYLSGSNIFLFTDLNPFKLVITLEKSKVKLPAKAGDIATHDVIVPAGNTGLPPGPIISQLNAVGIPTRIEAGSVWVTRDTLVAKKGDVINAQLASVLSKLGIKPVEAGLIMKAAYDDGLIIGEDQLVVDLEGVRKSIEEAHTAAFNLSLNVAYPLPENIPLLLRMAHQEAYRLALNVGIPSRETMGDLIRKAHMEVLKLYSHPSLEDYRQLVEKG